MKEPQNENQPIVREAIKNETATDESKMRSVEN